MTILFASGLIDTFMGLSGATKISIVIAAVLVILLIVLIVATIKVLAGSDDDDDDYDDYEEREERRERKNKKPEKKRRPAHYDEDEEEYEEDDKDEEDEAEERKPETALSSRLSNVAEDKEEPEEEEDEEEEDDDDDNTPSVPVEEEEKSAFDSQDPITEELTSDVKSAPDSAFVPEQPVVTAEPTIKIEFEKVKKELHKEAKKHESAAEEKALDSAFDIKESEAPAKTEAVDSAFDIKTEFENPYSSPVNPVNAVAFNTVNTAGMVKTKNADAGIENEEELEEYLSQNPVPKKKKKKTKKKDEVFDEKFGPTDFEIEGAKYFWYNSQDIADCKRKEDMYFHCHYFDNPERAVVPLITEMYDCAFVKTEELQFIAYGIQFKPLSFKEILNSDGSLGFDKSEATKEPSDADKKLIYKKWCEYVDNFLEIIVINASEDVKEFIKSKLYEYGKKDVDIIIYDHY